jgi:DNA-binding NarL/FixJ family response regulator
MESAHDSGYGTRAILADADVTVRKALRDLSLQALGMDVVAEAEDAKSLERQVRRLKPDLVVVAWRMLGPRAAALLHTLRASCDGGRIVVLGPRPDTRREALAAGADAYICMVDAPATVAGILRRASEDAAPREDEPGGVS